MELPVKFEDVENKIILLREQNVIMDSDVGQLYVVKKHAKSCNIILREVRSSDFKEPNWHLKKR